MKHSIKKIFQNLNTYLLFVLVAATLGLLSIFEHTLSFDKVDNLVNQKKIIASLTRLDKKDLELALIQFNGKSTQLHQEIDKLKTLYKYAYMDKYIVHNEQEYLADLDKLSALTDTFNQAAQEYYVDTKDPALDRKAKKNLDIAFANINKQIDTILLKNIHYNEEKFKYIKYAVIIVFVLILLATFYYRKAINAIYKDIEFLLRTDKNRKTYNIYSQEADAISLRMNRKTVSNDNPDMLDPVTEINNYKGMVNEYSIKKRKQDSNFTSVTVFEIDNFSKSNRAFPQDVTQTILKKVAYTISLHQQPVDVIARTDYNQFTVILSRSSKEQCFKDAELIRESVAELKFNIPHKGTTQITMSGGFIIKPNNTSLEEAIKQAKEILHYAQSLGTNKIMQTRDLAQKDM
ncbi:diguanylate cyclase domain-containing protein [Sulfurimonas paralvinellae]|uniref:Diguanylate cyclase n=1 Tax=Sulfurimonas paralvinellae TaxID=317658 RepID=A0A7M1B9U1_9BACT|nr:diguanylate cyclase [Sulfurimonas paralvinellae]QOP45598.1 diguanylate cyclase [Sulfurimonas paralvinellae]